MTLLVPVMMYGWVPLTASCFFIMPPRKAVLCSVIGGVLFLPMANYDLPGVPTYSKTTAIALGLLLGGFLSGHSRKASIQWGLNDFAMALWCFICPMVTSLSNGLGLYDGLSSVIQFYLGWGVFYWAGRKYFHELSSLRDLCIGIIIGGLIYIPLCLYELRMSPQLSNIFYGFFPHSWSQHFRYGGYRPIVFMQHGLMVALWMALSFTVAFWLWRSKKLIHIQGLPMGLVVFSLLALTILCKSANALFFVFVGCICYLYVAIFKSTRILRLIILLIPSYITLRVTKILPLEFIQTKAGIFFNEERVASLTDRLIQEDLFSLKALQHLYFGWGGWARGWPIDPDTGKKVLRAVDSLWVIIFSGYGIIGLSALFFAMLIGPWIALKNHKNIFDQDINNSENSHIFVISLSIIVIFFMIDSLFNGMINPVYILCSGAVANFFGTSKQNP